MLAGMTHRWGSTVSCWLSGCTGALSWQAMSWIEQSPDTVQVHTSYVESLFTFSVQWTQIKHLSWFSSSQQLLARHQSESAEHVNCASLVFLGFYSALSFSWHLSLLLLLSLVLLLLRSSNSKAAAQGRKSLEVRVATLQTVYSLARALSYNTSTGQWQHSAAPVTVLDKMKQQNRCKSCTKSSRR